MDIKGTRLLAQAKRARSAFVKVDCQPTDVLLVKYALSHDFIKQLLKVDLLHLTPTSYCKGKHWLSNPNMSFGEFLDIIRSDE